MNGPRVLDSVSGPVKVSPTIHGGMHDLLVHGTDRWVWNGKNLYRHATGTGCAASLKHNFDAKLWR